MSEDLTRPDKPGASPREEEADEDSLIGTVIDGRYEVIRQIGAGGMGFVHEARHVNLNRRVVIKTLRPELVDSARSRERFTREAQSSTRIQHSHVIRVLDYGVHAVHGAYYVMEHLAGVDLAAAMRQVGGPVPLDRALHIVRQVTDALAAAHALGIVHRDLKPENIFLTTENDQPDFVKVLDFGLARLLDTNRRLTETGQVIGTPRYMAPEQCRGEKVDAHADVYSLGLVLWEMLTGRQPYAGFGTYEILGNKMFEEIAAPSALDPPVMLPPVVEALLVRCLSRDSDARPADGAALSVELRALVSELGLDPGPFAPRPSSAPGPYVAPPSSPSTASMPAPVAVKPPPRRRGLFAVAVAVAAALAMMVAASGLVWFVASDPPAAVTAPVAAVEAPAAEHPAAQPETSAASAAPTEVVAPAPRVWVTVVSEPSGAEVRHDGVALGPTPLRIDSTSPLTDGDAIELHLAGYQPREITLSRSVPRAHVRLHPVGD